MRGDSRHLCQCRFCLRQPQCHPHGVVERDSGGQGGTGRLMLIELRIQRAEAPVAVGSGGDVQRVRRPVREARW